MNLTRIVCYGGIAFFIAGGLVVLTLVVWWLSTGHWIAVSLIDSISFLSPHGAATVSIFLSESDVFYFIFAEMPLYGLLFVLGGLAILSGLIFRVARK